ncbi:MAG: flagellar motor protein MotB, partial [Bryobacteraceae bacterium]
KKGGHGAHHGGAWKVAYADFVTAMMALFIVLWLMNTNQDVQKAVGAYFRDPTGKGRQMGSGQAGVGDDLVVKKDDMSKLKQKLAEAMKQMPDFQKLKNQVQMTVTGEGLRVELLETAKGMFFESGSAQPSESGKELLDTLAGELGKLPNNIMIEGHTDSKPFAAKGAYTNWELSSDRANAARRLMEDSGLRPKQVTQVRGFADQRLRKPAAPEDPSNRRISVIVQYLSPPQIPESTQKIAGKIAPPGVRD